VELVDYSLIVGLGNIGSRYSGTRHNVGFYILDSLTERFQFQFSKKKIIG